VYGNDIQKDGKISHFWVYFALNFPLTLKHGNRIAERGGQYEKQHPQLSQYYTHQLSGNTIDSTKHHCYIPWPPTYLRHGFLEPGFLKR